MNYDIYIACHAVKTAKSHCRALTGTLVAFLPRNSLSGVADLVKRRRTRQHFHEHKLSRWQIILLQNKVNGCFYHGEDLPQTKWESPKNTWFQERVVHQLKIPDLRDSKTVGGGR